MVYFVYILKSDKDNSRYTGLTNNLKKRLDAHNNGRSQYTRHHRPYHLIHFEKLPSLIEARKREKYLKSGLGRQFIDKLNLFPCSSVGRAIGC